MGDLGKEEAAVEIVKARTDKREYRRIVLKNSLEVLLISDPETDKTIRGAKAVFNAKDCFRKPQSCRGSEETLHQGRWVNKQVKRWSSGCLDQSGSKNKFLPSMNRYWELSVPVHDVQSLFFFRVPEDMNRYWELSVPVHKA